MMNESRDFMVILTGIITCIIILLFFLISKRWRKKYNIDKSELEEQQGFYDIHTHILPGVDHGAADMETAIDMIRQEYESGIRHIVLTPHYYSRENKKEDVIASYRELCKRVAQEKIPVKLYQGQEFACSSETLTHMDEGLVLSLGNTSYVLVEFQPDVSYTYIKNKLSQIQMKGYRPVVAHMERYEALRKRQAVVELTGRGILMQANANSFRRKEVQHYLIQLAKEGMIHLIGSDCHNLHSRPPGIGTAVKILKQELTKEEFEKIFFHNPADILNNQYIW